MAGTEDNPIGSPATSSGNAAQLAGLAQAHGTEGVAGFGDTAVVTKAAENDAPASEAADAAVADPGATRPFRLVIHFILPAPPEQTGPRGPERIRGTKHDDVLFGDDGVDHFDANAGGNDVLYGKGGNDLYWLGFGTGHDWIDEWHPERNSWEGDPRDVIRLKEGHSKDDVRLEIEPAESPNPRAHLAHLRVSLLDANSAVTDSYTVKHHFGLSASDSSSVERVESADGELLFDLTDQYTMRIRGGPGNDVLHGYSMSGDHFDADAGGDDVLVRRGSENVYWLGPGTGRDTIKDASGAVRLERGFTADNVRLVAEKRDLHVVLVDAQGVETDRYMVLDQFRFSYSPYKRAIDRVELSTGDPVFGEADFFAAWHRALIEDGYQPDPAPEESEITPTPKKNEVWWRGSGRLHDNFAVGTHEADTYVGDYGNDIYWLGTDTGHDLVREDWYSPGSDHDAIIVKKGISAPKPGLATDPERAALAWGGEPSVRVHRDKNGQDLVIDVVERLPDGEHKVLSSLSVREFFTSPYDGAQIEHIVFVEDPSASLSLKDLLAARIIGGPGDDSLKGGSGPDIFDSFEGGNDRLYGYRGNDVYHLGIQTGIDTIREHFRNTLGDSDDRVIVKEGIHIPELRQISRLASSDVPTLRIRRSNDGKDLRVEVVSRSEVISALIVDDHYTNSRSKIEGVYDTYEREVASENDLENARITGDPGDDYLHGIHRSNDQFDGNAGGNDKLYGYDGSDTYWLGTDTGDDIIREFHLNTGRGDVDRIRVRAEAGGATLSYYRSTDGQNLHVALLQDEVEISSLVVERQFSSTKQNAEIEEIWGADGSVISSEMLAVAKIVGDEGNNHMRGRGQGFDDHFDISAGGNDFLYGYSGSDIYWLGTGKNVGTGTIREHSNGYWGERSDEDFDVIRLKEVLSTAENGGRQRSLRVSRSDDGNDLRVDFLVGGDVSSSYVVENQYSVSYSNAEIEAILSVDGLVIYDAEALLKAPIAGGEGDDRLHGKDAVDDHFDGSAGGTDHLYGYGGNDVYWLDAGTGSDYVHEYHENENGDSGDAIRIVSQNIRRSDVDVAREGDNLVVRLTRGDGTPVDSITVVNHFSDETGRVERIELNGMALAVRDLNAVINGIAEFNIGDPWGTSLDLVPDGHWQSPPDFLVTPGA